MIEKHPFGIFVPDDPKYLMLGSFTGQNVNSTSEPGYDWYYGTKRNQFWKIIEQVFETSLPSKQSKIALFTKLRIALGDLIEQCERVKNSNLDVNLVNIVYNTENIAELLKTARIEKIYFTSRFVESKFRRHFAHIIKLYPEIELVTLPSPSPRFAAMSLTEKIRVYTKLLPSLYPILS